MNLFRVNPSGSPLQSRATNTKAYWFVVIAAAIILVFFVIKYAMYLIKKRRQTPKWLAAQKKRATGRNDVEQLGDRLKLSKEERQLLWTVCKNSRAPNIFYLAENSEAVDKIFGQEFRNMKNRNDDALEITMLFRLRHKIDKEIAAGIKISSTTALKEETNFICYTEAGQQIGCVLKKNTADGLLLEIPQQLFDSPDRPAELSKTLFSFNYPSITRYEFTARIVRYDRGIINGAPAMFVSHSSDLKISAKRGARRIDWVRKTVFYAVGTDGKKYTRKEKAYNCAILNISGDGCCVLSALPIKQGQLIDLDIPLEHESGSAVGKIVDTRRTENGQYTLHIAFVQVEPSFRNELFALTYGYANQEEAS